jgi:hypothetical protein
MKKSFFAGLKQHEHDYLVKTNDLKANCDLAIEGRDVKIKELENENKKLESDFRICEKNADTYYDQLTKAKDLLQRFIKWARTEHCEKFDAILVQAEQFLKDENIILEDAQAGNSPFDADEVFKKEMKAYPEEK